jgi:hypothetical protein
MIEAEEPSRTFDGVADAELVLLMGFWTDGHFEQAAGHTTSLSIKDQGVPLVLMGRDLIERTNQTNSSLDADNCAGEFDFSHLRSTSESSRPYRKPSQAR